MNFQITVVGIHLAGQETGKLQLRRASVQRVQQSSRLVQRRLVLFDLAQFGKRDGIVQFQFQPAVPGDRLLQVIALAHHLLRRLRVVPQIGVFGERVQFVQSERAGIQVKDASSAARMSA
jgi:hypothetical protein